MTVRSHFRRAGRHEEKAQSETMADSRMNGKVHQISRFLAVANQNQAHPRFQSETNSKSKERKLAWTLVSVIAGKTAGCSG